MTKFILFVVASITLQSCAVDYTIRKNKDTYIDKTNSKKIEGEFICKGFKKVNFLNRFTEDTLAFAEFTIKVQLITNTKVQIECICQDTTFLKYVLSGKYKNGYFKTRTKTTAKWVIGPLLWGLRQENRLIGISKDNKLVIINAGGGTGFALCIPFFCIKQSI